MSWGERSCTAPCQADDKRDIRERYCKIETCNVDCPAYKWDGVTPPDSVSRPPRVDSMTVRMKALSHNGINRKMRRKLKR